MDTVRKFIIGLVCLLGLAVVVDFAAAAYSEYRVSRTLRAGGELPSDPEVTIHGFPFLTQAYAGKYENIAIRAYGVKADVVNETFIEANLFGVRLPTRDIAEGKVHSVAVDRVDGAIRIDATELGQLYGIPDLQVSAPPADKSDGTGGSGGSGLTTSGGVVLTGTVPTTGPTGKGRFAVKAELVLEADVVRIVASDLYRGPGAPADQALPEPDRGAVLGRFTHTIDTRSLPFGLRPTKVTAEGSQVVIQGSGDNVVIDLDELQKQR